MPDSDDLAAALRIIASADPTAFADPDHMRSLLLDVAPDLSQTQVDQCVQAVRYRLPDLLRSSVNQPVDHVTGVLASRMGLLDGAPYYDVVTAFAGALGTSVGSRTPTAPEVPTELHEPTATPPPAPTQQPAPTPQPAPPQQSWPPQQPPQQQQTTPQLQWSPIQQPLPVQSPPQYGYGPQPGWGPPGPPAPPNAGRSRKKLWIAIAVAVVLAGGGTAAGIALAGSSKKKPPPPPPKLAAPRAVHTQVSSTGITVSWSAVTGAKDYQVFRDGASVGTATSTELRDTAANTAASHVYLVKAVDRHGLLGRPSVRITSPTLADATKALAAMVPSELALAGNCIADPQGESTFKPYGVTEVECTPRSLDGITPQRLYVDLYPTTADYNQFMTDHYYKLPQSGKSSICLTASTSDRGVWFNYDTHTERGKFYCFSNTSNGVTTSVISWTYPQQLVRIQVESDTDTISNLNTWWQRAWDDHALDLGA